MYYNKLVKIWVLDPFDYFLISAFIGSIAGSRLKTYLSEKAAMERLKKSILKKSRLIESESSDSKSTDSVGSVKFYEKRPSKININKVFRFALSNRGGQNDLDFKSSCFFKI